MEKVFKPEEYLIDLKGKKYLPVHARIKWWRIDKPDWGSNTEIHSVDENGAIMVAKIYDENGVQKSSGHGSETLRDFKDYIEKAETKAMGRALAMLGYGTQFTADEFDEGERIADAPVPRARPQQLNAKRAEDLPTVHSATAAGFATKAQMKQILTILGGDPEKCKALLEKHGCKDSRTVPANLYPTILSAAKQMEDGASLDNIEPLPWEVYGN